MVYNKTLFAQAGLQPPGPGWTWNQFVADAKKLTNPAKKQFGTAYVTPGSEDTVWHWEVLLWEAGGKILTPDNKKAAFDSPAGLKSLSTLQSMAVTDKSMYLDPTDQAYANVFNSGKIGMLVTGPWDLGVFPNVHYGVQIMPSFPGTSGGHQTISGPDNWVIFNNGSAHVAAAEKFVVWLTAPAQVKSFSLHTGDLPHPRLGGQRRRVPGQAMNKTLPGVSTFIDNLTNVHQARPQIPTYPKISTALANMVVSVLDGSAQPAGSAVTKRRPAGEPDSRQPEPVTWPHRRPRSAVGPGQALRAGPGDGGAAPIVTSSQHFTGWAFVTPGVAIILLFGAVPVVWSAVMSFQRNNLLSSDTPYRPGAWHNYRTLVHDPAVAQSDRRTRSSTRPCSSLAA